MNRIVGAIGAMLLVSVIGAGTIAQAQTSIELGVDPSAYARTTLMGLRVGPNLSIPSGKNPMWDLESTWSYGFGGFLSYSLGNHTSAQVEINYVDHGVKSSNTLPITIDLTYLELPLLFRYSILPAGKLKPFFMVGLNTRFLLDASLTRSILTEMNKLVNQTVDITGELTSVDFGLAFALGLEIPAGRGKLILDLRFNLGLSDISIDSSRIFDNNWRNFLVASSLGYGL